MLELTFGEQVKIILNRKGMTIKELAELIEENTGKKMSRQNLTQRLSRDNFQEQDMRMIAGILGCPLHLSILDEAAENVGQQKKEDTIPVSEEKTSERDITVGELLDMNERLDAAVAQGSTALPEEYTVEELLSEIDALELDTKETAKNYVPENEEKSRGLKGYLQRHRREREVGRTQEDNSKSRDMPMERETVSIDRTAQSEAESYIQEPYIEELYEEEPGLGDVNPYTGREYETNTVRMHPERIGYVQVYDRAEHSWTDMTEWAFLGYQERKKALLGKDYESPIFID